MCNEKMDRVCVRSFLVGSCHTRHAHTAIIRYKSGHTIPKRKSGGVSGGLKRALYQTGICFAVIVPNAAPIPSKASMITAKERYFFTTTEYWKNDAMGISQKGGPVLGETPGLYRLPRFGVHGREGRQADNF